MVSQKHKYCKNFERNSHWRKLSMIIVWERYCNASPKPEFFLFSLFIFSFISRLMWVRLGWNFHTQMILHTETSKLMYNWSFLFEVLHKLTLLPSSMDNNKSYKYCYYACSPIKGENQFHLQSLYYKPTKQWEKSKFSGGFIAIFRSSLSIWEAINSHRALSILFNGLRDLYTSWHNI